MLNEEHHETEPDWRAIPMGCGFTILICVIAIGLTYVPTILLGVIHFFEPGF
jgi:hypothetical protein